jgi:DNA-binding response OmpR family regulator
MNIAIIDPDLSQTSQIEQALMLSNEQWQTSVTCESVPLEFMLNSQWLNEPFDCFIFNGIDLLSQVSLLKSVRRQSKTYVPMIVLTHTRAESEFVALLDAGADDCLCKPFRPRELSARVQSLFRQVMQITASAKKTTVQASSIGLFRPGSASPSVSFMDYVFHSASLLVTFLGRKVQLTHMEFTLALYLFENVDNSLTRQQISKYLWGVEHDSSTRTLDALINKLKRKLELTPEHGYRLRSVYGFGYRLQRVDERIRKFYQVG